MGLDDLVEHHCKILLSLVHTDMYVPTTSQLQLGNLPNLSEHVVHHWIDLLHTALVFTSHLLLESPYENGWRMSFLSLQIPCKSTFEAASERACPL